MKTIRSSQHKISTLLNVMCILVTLGIILSGFFLLFHSIMSSFYVFRLCWWYWAFLTFPCICQFCLPCGILSFCVLLFIKSSRPKRVHHYRIISPKTKRKKRAACCAACIYGCQVCCISQLCCYSLLIILFGTFSIPQYGNMLPFAGKIFSVIQFDNLPWLQGKIEKDANQVVHIRSPNVKTLFYGQGYTHALHRMVQMDYFRRIANGQLHEWGRGKNDKYIKSDLISRVLGFKKYANSIISEISVEAQENLAAYAAGVNAYVESAPTPFEYKVSFSSFGRKWQPTDSLAVLKLWQWSISGNFNQEMSRLRLLFEKNLSVGRVLDLEPPSDLSNSTSSTFTPQNLFTPQADIPDNIQKMKNKISQEANNTQDLISRIYQTFGSVYAPRASNYDSTIEKDKLRWFWDTNKDKYTWKDPDQSFQEFTSFQEMSEEKLDGTSSTFGSIHRDFSKLFVVFDKLSDSGFATIASSLAHKLSSTNLFFLNHMRIDQTPFEVIGPSIPSIPGIFGGKTNFFQYGLGSLAADVMDFYILLLETTRSNGNTIQVLKDFKNPNTTIPFTTRQETIIVDFQELTINVIETNDYGVVIGKIAPKSEFMTGKGPWDYKKQFIYDQYLIKIMLPDSTYWNSVKNGVKREVVIAMKWAAREKDSTIEWITSGWMKDTKEEFSSFTRDKFQSPPSTIVVSDLMASQEFIITGKIPSRQDEHAGLFPVEANEKTKWISWTTPTSIPLTTRFNSKLYKIVMDNPITEAGYYKEFGFDFYDGFTAKRLFKIMDDTTIQKRSFGVEDITSLSNDYSTGLLESLKPILSSLQLDNEKARTVRDKIVNEWNGNSKIGDQYAPILERFFWELSKIFWKETGIKYFIHLPEVVIKTFSNPIKTDPVCQMWSEIGINNCKQFAEFAFLEAISKNSGSNWGKNTHLSNFKHPYFENNFFFSCVCERTIGSPGTTYSPFFRASGSPETSFNSEYGQVYEQILGSNGQSKFGIPFSNDANVYVGPGYDYLLQGFENSELMPMNTRSCNEQKENCYDIQSLIELKFNERRRQDTFPFKIWN